MSIDLEDVLTEADLDEALGNRLSRQPRILPAGWTTAEPARRAALTRLSYCKMRLTHL